MNTFGERLRLTTFGESHGPAMGGVLDGMPPGIAVDFELMRDMLERRRPGSSAVVSQRQEADEPQILSGISAGGLTLGTPIGFIVANTDSRPKDYGGMAEAYRPNHADYTYWMRYGIRDAGGGGRASARETVSRVIAGAIAASWLRQKGISVESRLVSVAGHTGDYQALAAIVRNIASRGDSAGGVVETTVSGMPAGVGEPVYGKLHARLGEAMLSINGVKGFEYGDGFSSAEDVGTRQADVFCLGADGNLMTRTNHSGGIQGGISNGMPIVMRVAFKPTPTFMSPVETVDVSGQKCLLKPRGRHDPCIALRGAVVCEAMAWLAVGDAMRIGGHGNPDRRYGF